MKMNEDDDKDKMDITNKSIDQLLDDLNNNSSDMNNPCSMTNIKMDNGLGTNHIVNTDSFDQMMQNDDEDDDYDLDL